MVGKISNTLQKNSSVYASEPENSFDMQDLWKNVLSINSDRLNSCDPENRYVLFEYSDSSGSHVVNARLTKFEGILQNDGYSGYNDLRARKTVKNVGCFAHCRRKFTDVIKASSDGKQGRAQE